MDKELAEIEGMLNRIREMLNKNEISEEQREKYEGFWWIIWENSMKPIFKLTVQECEQHSFI